MADLIKLDKNKDLSRQLIRAMQLLREGAETLEHVRAIFIQGRDNDGSLAADYALLVNECGYEMGDYDDANAAAKASFDEMDSLRANVVNATAAINQACAKHGV